MGCFINDDNKVKFNLKAEKQKWLAVERMRDFMHTYIHTYLYIYSWLYVHRTIVLKPKTTTQCGKHCINKSVIV